jgi:hypothetical protein
VMLVADAENAATGVPSIANVDDVHPPPPLDAGTPPPTPVMVNCADAGEHTPKAIEARA